MGTTRQYIGKQELLFIFVITLCLISTCGENGDADSQDGDIDNEKIVSDVDKEIDTLETDKEQIVKCEVGGCENGLYCDVSDGKCKTCMKDLDCGDPDPIKRITPICKDGKCTKLVCGSVVTPTPPLDGEKISSQPFKTTFSQGESDFQKGIIVANGQGIFPVGAHPLKQSLFAEAKSAGFNLIVSDLNCCSVSYDMNDQIAFLNSLKNNSVSMFGAVRSFWPPSVIDNGKVAELKKSVVERVNLQSLLFWIGADHPSLTNEDNRIGELADYVKNTNENKPFSLIEKTGYSLKPVKDKLDMYIADLDTNSTAPGAEVRRAMDQLGHQKVLARIDIRGSSESKLKMVAMHAIGHGAKGIIFAIDKDETGKSEDWEKAKKVARYIRDKTVLWLSPREGLTITVSPDTPELSFWSTFYQGKVYITYLVNSSDKEIDAKLTYNATSMPYCFADQSEDNLLHFKTTKEIDIKVKPGEIKALQISEASLPGDE